MPATRLRGREAGPPSPFHRLCPVPITRTEESSEFRRPMTDESWQDAVRTLAGQIDPAHRRLLEAVANEISLNIKALDTLMDRYCRETCPSCGNPCCDGREVFYNRADILYLLGTGKPVPPGQTRRTPGEACRYLTSGGCLLPRDERPYVCVWFLCEPQMELFQAEKPATQRQVINTLLDTRSYRLGLESLFDKSGWRLKEVHSTGSESPCMGE